MGEILEKQGFQFRALKNGNFILQKRKRVL